MNVRFNRNPDGEPHIHDHRVEVYEVLEALNDNLECVSGSADSTVVIGRTRSGRVLKVIHAPSRDGDGIFVVTAYDLPAKTVAGVETPAPTEAIMKKKIKRRRTISRTPASHYPKGWNQTRADEVARYYDNQSDDEAIAEAEAAYRAEGFAMIQVPVRLVPAVRKLLAKGAG